MFNKIDDKIKHFETIIIHRHANPDMDAIGTQLGLYYLIKENHPKKDVYVVGDKNKFIIDKEMDVIPDELYENALVFIVDVAVKEMISDDRYNKAKKIVIIDHHENEPNIKYDLSFINTEFSSAAEYVTHIFRQLNYKFNKDAARYLYYGMVTDTGRFRWMKNPENVFDTARFLVSKGINIEEFYNFLYTEPLESKKMKTYFQSKIVYEDGIAYLKNDKEVFDKFDIDFFTVSRGMANLASGIDEIKIWLNFTYNIETNKVVGEFRSRSISIVEVAKKYGGGGHANACGATLKDFQEADLVIEDFKKLLKEYEDGN